MPVITKPVLKTYFETGDVPTQSNFEDLIDSCYNEGGVLWDTRRITPDSLFDLIVTPYSNDMVAFSSNGGFSGFDMLMPVPHTVKKIKSLQFTGQIFNAAINFVRLSDYADAENLAYGPSIDFQNGGFIVYNHLLFHGPILIPSTGSFMSTLNFNIDLPYNHYRYLHLRMQMSVLTGQVLRFKPLTIEYE